MSFALNGHDVLLPIQPKIKQSDFHFTAVNSAHAHLALSLSLSLDIPTTWPNNTNTKNNTIRGFDYTFPLEFAPNYGWIAEDHGFKCRVVNVTVVDNNNTGDVVIPLNNTGGRLVKLNTTPLQRISTHQFSYDLTTSQDLPGGHKMNLECVVHVNPGATKLQASKTRMYLIFGNMYDGQDTHTNAQFKWRFISF